jgi:hypothetical protein
MRQHFRKLLRTIPCLGKIESIFPFETNRSLPEIFFSIAPLFAISCPAALRQTFEIRVRLRRVSQGCRRIRPSLESDIANSVTVSSLDGVNVTAAALDQERDHPQQRPPIETPAGESVSS